jgi:soluble lytic murein transglycosylase-like protein
MKSVYLYATALIAVIYYFYSKEKSNMNTSGNSSSVTPLMKIKNRFNLMLQSIIYEYNLKINPNMVLALIKIESGLSFETLTNAQVIGDNGKSIGYMQISNGAVLDVNSIYKKSFTFSDLNNEEKNLTIGCLYLNYCYEDAINDKSSNPISLAYKKYNGGPDESDTSYNAMATTYGNKVFNTYLQFLEL